MEITLQNILDAITEVAPLHWQESYDNAGIQVGDADKVVHKVLVALDVTEAVLDEAIAKGCDLVVSHHPLIFHGLKHITSQTYIERCVVKAIKNDMAILSMHTNLDNSYQGVSRCLAERLDMHDLRILQPMTDDPLLCGAGVIGELRIPMTEEAFLSWVKVNLGTPCLRHSALTGKTIHRVALCGGTGTFLLPDARRQNADAFLSADMKYHEFFNAENDILMVDGGHFETEQYTKELIRDLIQKKFPTFAAEIAETCTNSVHYFVEEE